MLAHTLAVVAVCCFSLFRIGAVVTLQCGGLVAVSHDLSRSSSSSKSGSEGLPEKAWSRAYSEVTATAPANKLHQIALFVSNTLITAITSHTSDRVSLARLLCHLLSGWFLHSHCPSGSPPAASSIPKLSSSSIYILFII